MTLACVFFIDQLRYGWNIIKKAIAHFFKCGTDASGKVVKNTVFYITVFYDIVEILGYDHQGFEVLRILIDVLPKLTLPYLIRCVGQIGTEGVPFPFFK